VTWVGQGSRGGGQILCIQYSGRCDVVEMVW